MPELVRWAIPAILLSSVLGALVAVLWERWHPTSYPYTPEHRANLRASRTRYWREELAEWRRVAAERKAEVARAAALDAAAIEATARYEQTLPHTMHETARQPPHRTSVTPNPPSPYADADHRYRHLFPVLWPELLGDPEAGLLLTGCGRLAVVPDEPLDDVRNHDLLPDGLCPICVAVMNGSAPPLYPIGACRQCEARTAHNGLCAECRIEQHEAWQAARGQATDTATAIDGTAT
ncbi:hypothetical protein [Streptomyces cavernae]|uniref:hypothetical protein n=1 Tax=Streptomyces cavernae TaxID=2259034 RepID=UPI000FEBAFB5|nr:hypothetical protein [Streptomyces cavernae]